jgi:hypothetical protein
MTRWRLLLPLVLLVVSSVALVRTDGVASDGLPMLLVLVGGAVLAGGVAYAMYRHRMAR